MALATLSGCQPRRPTLWAHIMVCVWTPSRCVCHKQVEQFSSGVRPHRTAEEFGTKGDKRSNCLWKNQQNPWNPFKNKKLSAWEGSSPATLVALGLFAPYFPGSARSEITEPLNTARIVMVSLVLQNILKTKAIPENMRNLWGFLR